MITYKQLSLADIFTDCQNKFDNDKYEFLTLINETINLEEFVPVSFVNHFHASSGRPRRHLLFPMLKALLLQLIFSIPTVSLLIIFLKFSQELRDFCGFSVVPDASKFTRFKQDFLDDLQSMFHRLVDMTQPICQQIDAAKASMLLFDTSGIEAAPCRPTRMQTLPYSRCISTGISAMPINSASLQTALALSGTLLSIIKIFWKPIRISPLKRNPIPQMKIKASQTQKCSSPC